MAPPTDNGVRRSRLRRKRKLRANAAEVAQRAQMERPEVVPVASPSPAAPGPSEAPGRFDGLRAHIKTLDRDGVREQLEGLEVEYDGRLSTSKLKAILFEASRAAAESPTDGDGG